MHGRQLQIITTVIGPGGMHGMGSGTACRLPAPGPGHQLQMCTGCSSYRSAPHTLLPTLPASSRARRPSPTTHTHTHTPLAVAACMPPSYTLRPLPYQYHAYILDPSIAHGIELTTHSSALHATVPSPSLACMMGWLRSYYLYSLFEKKPSIVV